MSITPIDMQIIIPKATEVGKAQQLRDQQHGNQQQYSAVQAQQESDRKLKQVQNTEKSEGKKVKDDGRRRGKKQSGGSHGDVPGDEEDHEAVRMAIDTFRGRNIDIKM